MSRGADIGGEKLLSRICDRSKEHRQDVCARIIRHAEELQGDGHATRTSI